MKHLMATLFCLLSLGAGCSRSEPGFAVEEVVLTQGPPENCAWSIKNLKEDKLIISRVSYNGEFEGLPGYVDGWFLTKAQVEMPIEVTIGDRALFLQRRHWRDNEGYAKDVVFIEVETNRGKFRYYVQEKSFR